MPPPTSSTVTSSLLRMVIRYILPRNLLVTVAGSSSGGRQGFTDSPSQQGFIPNRYWVAARYIHAAVPVSQDTLARPNLLLSGPKMLDA